MQKKIEELESRLKSDNGQQINTDKVQNTNVESLAKAMKPWIKVSENRALSDRLGEG